MTLLYGMMTQTQCFCQVRYFTNFTYTIYVHEQGVKRLKEIKSSNLICQMKCLTFSDWIKLRLSIYATH